MPLPTKTNPRRYTVTAKVTGTQYNSLKRLANANHNGNMSQCLHSLLNMLLK